MNIRAAPMPAPAPMASATSLLWEFSALNNIANSSKLEDYIHHTKIKSRQAMKGKFLEASNGMK